MIIKKVSIGLLTLELMVCIAIFPTPAESMTWLDMIADELEMRLPLGWHQDDDAKFDPIKDVNNLPLRHAENTLDVRFIVIGDPHFIAEHNIRPNLHGAHYYIPNPNLPALRAVTDDINSTCNGFEENHPPGCTGVVSVGDMTRRGSDGFLPHHSLYYYRCLYDYDLHCGTDNMDHVLNRFQINYDVFPTLGNHDDPTDTEWKNAGVMKIYIRKRMKDSEALFQGKDEDGDKIENYYEGEGSDLYAWEWGSFHFISMGLWAFYHEYDPNNNNRASVSQPKVEWLKNHLKAIGKKKAIILFQHFGWDNISLDGKWWSHDNLELLKNVICDREDSSAPCSNPYNIVAIFSGHKHVFGYHEDILDGEGPRKIPNYQVDDAGFALKNGTDGDKALGYFHVRLNLMNGQLDNEGNLVGQMEVSQIGLKAKSDPKNEKHIVECERTPVEPWKTEPITTEFFLFDQGEPNGEENENCAEIKQNGRYNDLDCSKLRHILCYDPSTQDWHISSNEVQWSEGLPFCSTWYNRVFTQPQNIEDQRKIIELIKESGVSSVWVNYTDQSHEGDWEEVH